MRVSRVVLVFTLISVYLELMATRSAHAVIPQLLGPLSALASIIPQILAFVGIAAVTVLVFARDSCKALIYRLREVAASHKAVSAIIALVVISGAAWLVYQATKPSNLPITTDAKVSPTSQPVSPDKAAHSWSTFRGGATRTGHIDNLPGPAAGKPEWIFKDTNTVVADFSSSPSVAGDRLYIGSAQGSIFSSSGAVYCLNANSGDVVWRSETPTSIFSPPTVVGGRVYVGEGFHQDSHCHMRCLDANSGQEIWSFPTTSHVESSPSISQGKVYFAAGEDGVYCVDALEGKKVWHYPSVHVDISPLIWRGRAYFGTGYGVYQVYAVDANTGTEIWSEQVDYPVWGSPSAHENMVFFGLGNGNFTDSAEDPKGKVIALNAETGEPLWDYEVGDAVLTAIAYSAGYVYFGSRDGHLYALNAKNGDLHWKSSVGHPIVSSPAITDQAVYFGANDGEIYCLNISNGDVKWQFDTDALAGGLEIYSSPAIANGKLYIGSTDRYVICLGEDGGTVESESLDDR